MPLIVTDLIEDPDKSKSNNKDIPVDIPSPFKNNLFWPEIPKLAKKQVEKIPSVATSVDWQTYFRKKEDKKIEKEKETEDRKRKRQENKEQKQEEIIKKRNKKEKAKKGDNAKCTEKETEDECWFCFICEEECKENMIRCQKCLKWMHDRCAKITKNTTNFICQICHLE